MYSSLFSEALAFAAVWHDGQYRKGTKVPYIVHPMGVGTLLRSYGYGEAVQIAGLLHDLVEDTPCTLTQIEERFGTDIRDTVQWCTEVSVGQSWEERKLAMITKFSDAPVEAKAVAAADKIDNLHSILSGWDLHVDSVWDYFSRGPLKQLSYYQRISEAVATGFEDPIVGELGSVVCLFEKKVSRWQARSP